MGFMFPKDVPTPKGHYQTREQTVLFKLLSKFMNESNASIIRRFWWLCPDGNCTSHQLNDEIQRLRLLGQKNARVIEGKETTVPRKRRLTKREVRGLLR